MVIEKIIDLINGGLRKHVIQETQNLQLFLEADLSACIYNFIKSALYEDDDWPEWSVRCTPSLGNKYPDILVCCDNKPMIVMEIKFDINVESANIPYKELEIAYQKLKYFISYAPSLIISYLVAVFDAKKDTHFSTKDGDRNDRIEEIFINIREFDDYIDWKDIWSTKFKITTED